MIIKKAEYVISAAKPKQFPKIDRPEVAFAGRSNVGKSSLLNHLVQRKGLAKTSSKPGKTRLVNFFDINDEIYFVDLPGYGYAKVPLTVQEEWGKLMHQYLEERASLELMVLLLDCRHMPSKQDLMMWDWVTHFKVSHLVVLTKADKIPKIKFAAARKKIAVELKISPNYLMAYSTLKNQGREELWKAISERIL
jgi:GTP-binding protein